MTARRRAPARARAALLTGEDRIPVAPGTRHRDYILTSYAPRVSPEGRLQPRSLLRHILRREGKLEAIWPVIEALDRHLGPDETVWGAKWGPSGFALELYFYNFNRNAPDNRASATRIGEALGKLVTIDGAVDEALPYFMCSVELDGGRRAPPWRIYLGSGDQHRVECGFSYRAEAPDRLVMENHYWFYRAADARERADALRRVAASPRAGSPALVPALAPDELHDCHTICYAVKPRADGLYFSRVGTGAVARFLDAHGHADLAATMTAHADDFAHVAWDLGYDFALAPGATRAEIPKLAVHAVV